MVLRERKINNKSDVVQIHISYGLPDVKALFKDYANRFVNSCGLHFAKSVANGESDIREWLEHDPTAFGNYPEKWKQQLSAWAFAVAVRNKLLTESASKPNVFYFADSLFARRGRPRKESNL